MVETNKNFKESHMLWHLKVFCSMKDLKELNSITMSLIIAFSIQERNEVMQVFDICR